MKVGGVTAACAAMILVTAAPAEAAPGEELPRDTARAFVRPHDRVDIGGRALNLHCIGSGRQAVLFEAGGSDWSVIWALVQPAVATRFRACSYDRAGLGYSDPAMLPRSPVAIVEDMKALVDASKLPKPFILVGHSLGGFNAKLYAALHPKDVAGLVLVDPAEERQAERNRAFLQSRFGPRLAARGELLDLTFLNLLLERYRRCARLTEGAPLDPSSIDYRRCSDPVRPQLGPLVAQERARIQVTAAYQQAQVSEIISSVYGDTRGDAAYASLFRPGLMGRMPLIVLTHGDFDAKDELDALDHAAMLRLHQQTAKLSRIGVQRTVEGSGHNIEIDRPMAIVDAIEQVGRAVADRSEAAHRP
jgi:pimeloyl-ACP methyl ester carboxylesterase